MHFSRRLTELPDVKLPPGYHIRSVTAEATTILRAEATYRAFGNTLPWEEYLDRYQRFVACDAHIGERDLVVVTLPSILVWLLPLLAVVWIGYTVWRRVNSRRWRVPISKTNHDPGSRSAGSESKTDA